MQLESPHLKESITATADSISELAFRMVGAQDPFAIVAQNELTFAQVLWTDTGFILEYQAGSLINTSDLNAPTSPLKRS